MNIRSLLDIRRKRAVRSNTSNEKSFDDLVREANQFRDGNQPAAALPLYQQAAQLRPDQRYLLMQIGNMAKDSGQLDLAKNIYESELGRLLNAEKSDVQGQDHQTELYDVNVQLGHLSKLRKSPAEALEYFQSAARINDNPELLHEIRHIIATHDQYYDTPQVAKFPEDKSELERNHVLVTAPSISKARVRIALSDFNADTDGIYQPNNASVQCSCWSRSYRKSRNNYFICNSCGTNFRRSVTYVNENSVSADVSELRAQLSEQQFRELIEHLGLDSKVAAGSIAGINLDVGDRAEASAILSINIRSDGVQNRGQARCQFDIIIIPNLSQGLTDVRRMIDDCLRLLRPGGYLVFGAEIIDDAKAAAEPADVPSLVSTENNTLFRFSTSALRQLLTKPLVEEVQLRGNKFDVAWYRVRKKPVFSMGVMSGIGDAAWSFLFAEGVVRKYGAEHVQLHIHHSGDVRAKRSNNMLARFKFVDEIVGSKFDIHAHPTMDERSGHINYIPGGPVSLDSLDEFDYRLVFNTFLERGWTLDAVADMFNLGPRDINFNFFDQYEELDADLKGYRRAAHYVGQDYVIFHFGARNTNQTGGLNAGEIWKPEDWIELGRKINAKYNTSIIVIGAPYDLDYANEILGRTSDNFYLNVIGQMDITETLALIRRAKFVISFPSGVGIVGPYLNVPTCIFWRPKDNPYHPLHPRSGFEEEFSINWVPPGKLSSGLYYPAWYGRDTPDSIFDHIERTGWWHTKG
ncbi:tetratricopeptide (TPR) repeat protein [Bosea sp. BE125]|uniref:glycosyltransferase family 9 protein n=1 Tax=Bosea sp. BE125 TaxID=2817909 RepID=UPI0028616DE6|nr:glycosyltransferase family 9 protein [Bosea sp. BE125]MDR6874800.1 tetratricopeptide (TPR) repeat protein [Bosea sp. BE125]